MAMFDYTQKMSPPAVPEASKAKERGPQLRPSAQPKASEPVRSVPEESPVPVCVEQERSRPVQSGPVVLWGFPYDRVRSSLQPGMLRIDFPDGDSDTGKGSMFVGPGAVRQSVDASGSPVHGRCDVTISQDGKFAAPYYIVKDRKPIRSDRTIRDFMSAWKAEREASAEEARSRDISIAQAAQQQADREIE